MDRRADYICHGCHLFTDPMNKLCAPPLEINGQDIYIQSVHIGSQISSYQSYYTQENNLIIMVLHNCDLKLRFQCDGANPCKTGSLFRYVAQYTKLKLPNKTGKTILDIRSILLTLLKVFFASCGLASGLALLGSEVVVVALLEMVGRTESLVMFGA